MFVVLVTGAREGYPDRIVKRVLSEVKAWCDARSLDMLVIHGDAKGVDTVADRWAEGQGVQRVKVPADWNGKGKAAGPIRNQLMLDILRPRIELVLAFPTPDSKGTWDMVGRTWRTIETQVRDTGGHTIGTIVIEKALGLS